MASSYLVQLGAIEQFHRTVTGCRSVILLVAIQEVVQSSARRRGKKCVGVSLLLNKLREFKSLREYDFINFAVDRHVE